MKHMQTKQAQSRPQPNLRTSPRPQMRRCIYSNCRRDHVDSFVGVSVWYTVFHMKQKQDEEIEVRFLDIDKQALVAQLRARTDVEDLGEHMLKEAIFYDSALVWQKQGKRFVRVRDYGNGTVELTYKESADAVAGTKEIECTVSDFDTMCRFLEAVGLVLYRVQEKYRHTFHMKHATGETVIIDIDTWPTIPPYVEIEGNSEALVQKTAELLGFDYIQAETRNARRVIEEVYGVPVGTMREFTFQAQK
jgi:adenylate cyclase class 2